LIHHQLNVANLVL